MGTNASSGERADISDLSGQLSLFEKQLLADTPASDPCIESSERELRTVIRRFDELPKAVRRSEFTRVDKRRLNRQMITALLTQPAPPNCQCDWELRLQKRENSLVPHQDKVLHCILIQLPGAHYTIEVDLETSAVVHWEWQNT